MSKVKIWKIWIGDNPIPEHFKQYTDTWSRIKGGEVVEVTNKNVCEIMDTTPDDFEWIKQHFKQNNQLINHYIRYMLMYRFGGIYLDLDVEVLKDSPIWYLNKPTFFSETNDWHNNHVMVCNQTLRIIYLDLIDQTRRYDKSDTKPEINTGPGLITKVLNETDPYEYDLYSPEYTTPWNWNEKPDRSRITENTIAVHHFCHSWKK